MDVEVWQGKAYLGGVRFFDPDYRNCAVLGVVSEFGCSASIYFFDNGYCHFNHSVYGGFGQLSAKAQLVYEMANKEEKLFLNKISSFENEKTILMKRTKK